MENVMKIYVNPFFASPLLHTKIQPLPELFLQIIPWFIKIEKGLPLWGKRSSNTIKKRLSTKIHTHFKLLQIPH